VIRMAISKYRGALKLMTKVLEELTNNTTFPIEDLSLA